MSSMTLAPIYQEVTRLTAFNFLGQLEAFWGKMGQPGSNWAKSKTSTRYTVLSRRKYKVVVKVLLSIQIT